MMKNESGRSMVEMLGVLAIIGVLSVGGIAGYTMAMNKYKANEVAAVTAQCGIAAVAKKAVDSTFAVPADCSTLIDIDTKVKGYLGSSDTIQVTAVNADTATVTVKTDVTSGVGKALKGLAGSVSNFTLVVTS